MSRSHLLRGSSAGALALVLVSSAAVAQETLPVIDVGAAKPAARPAAQPNVAAPVVSGPPQPAVSAPLTEEKAREKREEHAYVRTYAISATKTDTPILDTPRSVAVIPHQVLEDNQVITVQEAVKFVSGVQPTNGYYDTFQLRGFNISRSYRNGLEFQSLTTTEDPSFIERIEILKGPASILYGRIEPGGLVNFVTKSPKEEQASSIQTQFGSWGLSRTTVDTTGPVDKEKTFLYRLIGTFDHADSFVNFQHHDNGAVFGALTWKPTVQFEANLQGEYYNFTEAMQGYYGQYIPAMSPGYKIPGLSFYPANLPRNWSQSDPSLYANDPANMQRYLIAADWTYHYNDDWKVTNRFAYTHLNDDQQYILSRNTATTTATTDDMIRRVSWGTYVRDIYSVNLNVNGKFDTGLLKHNLVTGFDYWSAEAVAKGDNPGGAGPEVPGTFNIFFPSYLPVAWPVIHAEQYLAGDNIFSRSSNLDVGYFTQDDISYNDFAHLFLGGRYDIAANRSGGQFGPTTNAFYKSTTAGSCFPNCFGGLYPAPPFGIPTVYQFSPSGGLLFKLTPEYSIYASYSKSFSNNVAGSASATGQVFPPEEALQYEAGGKASLYGGKLTASFAVFDLYRTNVTTPDPINPTYSDVTGEVRSRGVEFDVAGQVTDNISVIGSYTYDDAIVIKDNTTGTAAELGKRFPNVPRHLGNIWAKYDSAPGQKQGWQVGFGAYAVSVREGDLQNSFELPAYVRFDTMLGYRTVFQGFPTEFQLNVINLADEKYFEGTTGGNAPAYVYYGAPRTFRGSVKVSF